MYNLYSTDLEAARTLLYENMDRFLKTNSIIIKYWYDDIKQDAFMEIDWWIQKSIEKWFASRQAYVYIVARVRWFLLNLMNPTRNREKNIQTITNTDFIVEDKIMDLEKFLIEGEVIKLPPMHRSVILMRHMMWDETPFHTIAKSIWKSVQDTVWIYWQAVAILKDSLNPHNQ